MKRKSSKSQASAVAMLSAGVFMSSGASAQAPKAAPPVQKFPAAPQVAPSTQKLAPENKAATFLKFAHVFPKYGSTLTAAGMLNGRPVFKTAQGEFFQVDPQTGDLKFHTAESLGYLKMDDWERKAPSKGYVFIKLKGEQRVSVLGVDAQGNVLQQNNRGEKFYLNPVGDMVFVK
jgi:hypothetical protein